MKSTATTPKKPKLNIEYIGNKTKRCRKYDLTSLPKKIIKSLKAKRVKSKKYYKEGHRTST